MIQILLLSLTLYPHVHAEVGRATVFACEGDRHAGGPTRALGRRVRPDDSGYAHRTLPDHAPALIFHGLRWTHGRKIDSGPYGADHEGEWVIKRGRRDPGRWRGIVDLTPPLARDLGATRAQSRCAWSETVLLLSPTKGSYNVLHTTATRARSVLRRVAGP